MYDDRLEGGGADVIRASLANRELDLPDAFVTTPEFEVDARLVERWTDLSPDQLELAVTRVALGDLLTGLDMTESVAREHRNRAERANQLNSRLREAINRAARHGLSDQTEESTW